MTEYVMMDGNSSERNVSVPAWQGNYQEETFKKTMTEGSFMDQFRALIYRNLTIKKRDKRKTLTEFLMPLYWIMILAIIRISIGDTVMDAVDTPHGQAYLMNSTFFLKNEILHVAPNSEEVIRVMEEVQSISEGLGSPLYVAYFETEKDLVQEFLENKTSTKAAIIFPDDPLVNKSYTMRFNPQLSYLASADLWSGGQECREQDLVNGLQKYQCAPNTYYFSGFSALQTLIDMAFVNLTATTAVDIEVPEILLENFPRGRYESSGAMSLRNIVPLYMVFAWAQFIVYMMMLVVEEKEKKLKESMKMMGLRDSVYWLSWFTVYAMYVLMLSLICIILLPLATVFQKANLFLLFLLFVLYGSSSIMFGFMLTPFFNKAKVAGVVGNLVQICFSLLFYLQVYLEDEVDPGLFWGLAVLSPCAFAFAIDKVIYFDFAADGVTYASMWDGPGLPFAGSLIMISVDIVLYLFLAFYLDNVIPSEYGTKRKPWFIFQKSFWIRDHRNFHQLSAADGVANVGYASDIPVNPDVEPVSAEVQERTAVCIQNLEKIFNPKGKKPVKAVDGFSLNIYEGEITAILGHNGAGKTTLFNILTGMTAASSGSATIFGMDISDINDLTEIRRMTGICPQHDVVFLNLTPREHLRFFARIRGIPASTIEREVEQTLKEVFLEEKGDTKAADLSGGQKRKLSIAIALIGDPKMIFLDEPTAGVDAYSRRKLWTLLKNRKQGKVILLTTHFMDEADILADRKAIMSKGKLRCCGTSLFLKNKFGLGYHLTLIVAENSEEETVKEALQKVIPEVKVARYYGKEMSFILPSDSSPHFPSLFKQLDQSINASESIEGYGVSMTTLEEVFLALNEESEEGELGSMDNVGQHMIREKSPSASPIHSSTPLQENRTAQGSISTANKGFAIESVDVKKDSWRAFTALLKIRVTGVIREPMAVIFLILFPLAFTIASIALADSQNIKISTDDAPLLTLKPEIYKPSLYGALLYNATTHKLDSLVSTITSAEMEVDSYSGNYSDLVKEENYMGSFDVQSFPVLMRSEDRASVRLRFNDSYMHSIPILVNLLNNAIMSSITKADPIQVFSHALPITTDSVEFDVSSFIAPMMIGFAFTIIPAGLTMDLVLDREIKARYMLRLNGVGFHLYFSSYLIMITGLYMVSYIGLLIIIAAFGVKSLIIGPAFGTLAILYLLYIPAAILFSAVMSYLFDKSETARQFYPSMVTTLGFVTYTAVSLIDMLLKSDSTNPAQILHIVLTIICPPYIPFGLMYYINKVYIMCSVTNTCGDLTVGDYMITEIIVLFVVTIISIPFWYLLLRVADTVKLGGSWRTALWMDTKKTTANSSMLGERGVSGAEGEDEDVKQERENVAAALSGNSSSSPVLIYDLGKLYKKKVQNNPCTKKKDEESFPALKSVSLEVKSSQVFGLLGPNGAGKTTTLSIMTAEEPPSWGKVQICGEDIQSSMSAVFETMGYCPQHDALWHNITVAEHIAGYAEIRGIRKDQIKSLVDTFVKGLEIDEHRNKKSRDCSGGTKRKLSYILSMLGRPQVVLLDEPSTGMDPKSKRFLWNSILSSFRDERSAILTTHSMEEADALCSSIGILVRGSLRCIGPIQHLKNKYGGGYTLEVKVQKERASHPVSHSSARVSSLHSTSTVEQQTGNMIEKVQAVVQKTFPNAVLDEQFDERLIYKVPQTDVTSLGLIFETLEKIKSDGLVDEYALSQTTLEQVFLQFARQQEENEDSSVNEVNGSYLLS